ncbi:MAG TPA: sarcosine oxidase subunit gamma family protein [Acetobacteraceae bacterium]|jgi:sarcosine oxidase subunit gamma|nr:sarcosine oxidase subunit gamma family protein [Acetobacteraceae bacterium]
MAEIAPVETGPVFVLRACPELPSDPCRAVARGGWTALWMGPDEWLVIGAATPPVPTRAAVDVSHRDLWFDVTGSDAAELLAGGVPLDLDGRAFPVGMCTRTVFEKAGIVLWRVETGRWRIGVARSFAPYFRALLAAIAAANGIPLADAAPVQPMVTPAPAP